MKKSTLMIWLLLCLMLQSCEKISEIYQTIDSSKQFQSSPAQDAKAQTLYRALQSYDSNKLKPLLNASLRQEIEQTPVAMIDLFKLIPEGKANFAKLDQAQQSYSEGVGDMTTQVYTFEYVDLTVALTVVFKGHAGGDEILAFTLDQIQNDQQPHKFGVIPEIQADAIAMELPKTGLEDEVASSQSITSSTAIDGLLAQSRAITADLNADQARSLQDGSTEESVRQKEQVEPLTLKQSDRSIESNIQADVETSTDKIPSTKNNIKEKPEQKHVDQKTELVEGKGLNKEKDKAGLKQDVNQSEIKKVVAQDEKKTAGNSDTVSPMQGDTTQQNKKASENKVLTPTVQSQQRTLKDIESELSEIK